MKKVRNFAFALAVLGSVVALGSLSMSTAIAAEASQDIIDVTVGQKITVNNRTLTNPSTGHSKTVEGVIYIPDGSSFKGKQFVIEEPGIYKVVWKAIIDGEEIKEVQQYKCIAKGSDLFSISGSATKEHGSFSFDSNYKGTAFTVKNGAKINFNRLINLNNLGDDINKPFIDFVVDPTNFGECDIDQCYIRLTDSSDENNYLEFVINDGGNANLDRLYVETKYAGSFYCAYVDEVHGGVETHSIAVGGRFGAAIQSSFCASNGSGKDTPEKRSVKLYYDKDENAAYLYEAANGKGFIPIMDFDDPDVFKNSSWSGFKSDYVYCTITPSMFNNTSAKIVINSIGGYDLSSEKVVDNQKPTIDVDVSKYTNSIGNLPLAKVGNYYEVFSSKVNDNFDANLKCNIQVKYVDTSNGDIDIPIKNNKFFVEKEGTYKVIYSATDLSGNKADDVVLNIISSSSVFPITLEGIKKNDTCGLYEKYHFVSPNEVVTVGGSGYINVTRTIIAPDGTEIITDNSQSATLKQVGNYQVKYVATDVCDNKTEFISTISVSSISEPKLVSQPSLPKALIKGFSYDFDPVKAIEIINGEIVEFESKVKVDGEEKSSFEVDSLEPVTISYVAEGKTGTSSTISKTLNVVDTNESKDQSKYFYGDIGVSEKEDYLLLNCTDSNQESSFLNKISTSDFEIRFIKVPTACNYSNFDVILKDANDITSSLTFNIDVKNSKISIPGKNGVETYDLTVNDNTFAVGFSNSRLILSDASGNDITSIKYLDDKSDFKGFDDGAYLSFKFGNRTGKSQLKVSKLNNQPFGYDIYGMGLTPETADTETAKPIISLNDSFLSEQFIGNNFVYPTFKAFDVLSNVAETSITVTGPGGKLITGDKDCKDTFQITKYGSYTVKYVARDSLGNSTTLTRTTFVYDDVAPTLTVSSMKNEYSLNSTVTIPSYEASDNSGKYIVDVILILPSYEQRLLVHDVNGEKNIIHSTPELYEKGFYVSDNQFKVMDKGVHKLRFVCYDDTYNRTVVELTFNVK